MEIIFIGIVLLALGFILDQKRTKKERIAEEIKVLRARRSYLLGYMVALASIPTNKDEEIYKSQIEYELSGEKLGGLLLK
ncbi:MAG: hypothetical protein WC587_01615 [Candidatus Paceibacterota bacterium]